MNRPQFHLYPVDFVVLAAYMVGVCVIGLYLRNRKKGGAEEFLLVGRRLSLPLYIGTLVATWYGGILGVGEIAYRDGVVTWLTQGGFWYLSYFIFAFFLAGRLSKSKQVTLPDQIGILHGTSARYLAMVLNFFNVVPIVYILSLGLITHLVTGWPVWGGVLISMFVTILYSVFGGFRAVVYTDLLQFCLMCFAVALLMVYAVLTLGGSDYLHTHLPKGHLNLTGQISKQELLVWGLIALSTLVDPNFYQRCYAAESPKVAKVGILYAIGFWFLFDICTTFSGLYARAAVPVADPRLAYPLLADMLLPPGFKGIFFTGMLATVMSTIDSYCFVGAMTLSHDLRGFLHRGQERSDAQIVRSTQLGVVITSALAAGLALLFGGSIKSIWKTLGSLSTSAMLVPMMIGMLGWRPKYAGVVSMSGGIVGTLGWASLRKWKGAWALRWEAIIPGLTLSLLGYFIMGICDWIKGHASLKETKN